MLLVHELVWPSAWRLRGAPARRALLRLLLLLLLLRPGLAGGLALLNLLQVSHKGIALQCRLLLCWEAIYAATSCGCGGSGCSER
jgi:hypothetical protein